MDVFFNKNFQLRYISSLKFIINKFERQVEEGVYQIDDMIIVFDIDDTLITVNLSDDYHISIAEAFFKKGDIFNENQLDNIDYAILADKIPCEENTLNILDYINNNNINSVVITSRQLHLNKATIFNFSKNGILDLITKNKFFNSKNDGIKTDPNSLYNQNILLVSDQRKGDIFNHFLFKIDKSFKIIVVVDNTLDKINSFYKPFKDKSHVIGLLYTFIDPGNDYIDCTGLSS